MKRIGNLLTSIFFQGGKVRPPAGGHQPELEQDEYIVLMHLIKEPKTPTELSDLISANRAMIPEEIAGIFVVLIRDALAKMEGAKYELTQAGFDMLMRDRQRLDTMQHELDELLALYQDRTKGE